MFVETNKASRPGSSRCKGKMQPEKWQDNIDGDDNAS